MLLTVPDYMALVTGPVLNDIVEKSLQASALWDEVKDKTESIWSGSFRGAAAAFMHRPRLGC